MIEAVQEKKQVKIGDYLLTGKIGQGGVAEIYRARQESLDRDVAIKILSTKLSSDPDIVRRFERESIVIARLNHPNIVHVIDRGKAAGRYYFVMEYIDGTSLREIIDSDKVQLRSKLDMIVQVCKALDYAHKNGVIHRDIKPTNVLIDRQGNALVADFGIAQMVGTVDTEVTSSEIIMGTMAYMSPEQKVSSTNVDQTTDVYAVGVMMYEVLTGRKPMGHFKLPSELDPEITRDFDQIILKCLAQEPKDRYQSAVELKDAILEVLNRDESRSPADTLSLKDSDSFMGKCRYLDTIKETRFSSTILVENKVNKQLYVIKKYSRTDAGRKEAKILSKLKHDNIIDIYGAGGDNRSTVIITQYAQGGSLADRLVRKWDWQKAIDISLQIAAALDHAHKANIVHGNIRPSNILFDSQGVIKLADFGMPAHYEHPRKKNWYSAPELKRTRQGDIYAMGVVLHQMITGRIPSYDAAGNLRLDDVKMELPEVVSDMLARMLEIRVTKRYKTAEEFLLDWEDYQRERNERVARQLSPEAVEAKAKSSYKLYYILATAGILAGVIIALYLSGALR